MKNFFKNQPPPFYVIFMLELWERFGFYTTQALLTLYFIRTLHMTSVDAFYTFGGFSALVYSMVAFGGYLGDTLLGTKRTLLLGLIVLAAGYLALSFVPIVSIYTALALIAVGNGLFKANPSTLLSKCYDETDNRLDQAYTLYYMAINLGAFLALLLGPALSHHYGYSFAYLASFVAIVIAITQYILQKKHMAKFDTPADQRVLSFFQMILIGIGLLLLIFFSHLLLENPMTTKRVLSFIIVICFAMYAYFMTRETPSDRNKMMVALLLMVEAVLFFTLYQQLPTSLTLFAVHHLRHEFWGIDLDPQTFRILNSFWIITLSPLLVAFYAKLEQKNISFPVPYKFSLGLFCCGLGFGILYFARFFSDANMMISPVWIVCSYALQSIGELFVSALGISMIAALVPNRIRGFVMGVWFLTSAVAGFTGAFVASFTKVDETSVSTASSLLVYTDVFGKIGLCAIGLSFILLMVAPRLNKMTLNPK